MVTSKQTLGLCMIVRNEARVISRCLRSVRPLIDTWTICDTGSDDGTPRLIEELLGGVPGALHHRPWKNFGANRSELMELAAGSADYLLLLDADMTVELRAPLPHLEADSYLLLTVNTHESSIPLLVRGDRRWWFEGKTHELLATDGVCRDRQLSEIVVRHHNDGGNRNGRLDSDAKVLQAALELDPSDRRSMFYLAQTSRDLGEAERAIALYRQRAELAGDDEETFHAAYQAGCLLGPRDPMEAARLLLDAAQLRPGRAEPLYELSRICRRESWHSAAYAFARWGAALAPPVDGLFVDRAVYEWALPFELARAAHGVGRSAEAVRQITTLLASGRLDPEQEIRASNSLDTYDAARGGASADARVCGTKRNPVRASEHPVREPRSCNRLSYGRREEITDYVRIAASRPPPDELRSYPAMLSDDEKSLLFGLGNSFRGNGVIVDAGSFLGGSTFALAAGLAAKEHGSVRNRPVIHAFDRFLLEPSTKLQCGPLTHEIQIGATLRPEFERRMGSHLACVEVHEGDIRDASWNGEPIEILFLDICKSWEINDHVLHEFFPALIPGTSVIVQQDFVHEWLPHVAVTMGLLADYFEFIGFVPRGSAVFLTRRDIRPEDIPASLRDDLSDARKLECFDRACEPFSGQERDILSCARAMLLLEIGRRSEARNALRDVEDALSDEFVASGSLPEASTNALIETHSWLLRSHPDPKVALEEWHRWRERAGDAWSTRWQTMVESLRLAITLWDEGPTRPAGLPFKT